jgi:pyruvate/2-oxoacid:ferredoxin oxidoreductase beta subunit
MYDIGFQSLSRLLMSGMDIKVLVLDAQVYSNTGGQSSTATFTGHRVKMAAFGKTSPGKREHPQRTGHDRHDASRCLCEQTTPAHLNHFYRAVMEANEYPGPAIVICYAACMPQHGIADDRAVARAKLAADSRTFRLLITILAKVTYSRASEPSGQSRYSVPRNSQPQHDAGNQSECSQCHHGSPHADFCCQVMHAMNRCNRPRNATRFRFKQRHVSTSFATGDQGRHEPAGKNS